MRFLLLLIFSVLQVFALPAQSPSYVQYGVREGLPSNKLYCATQDSRGFIWFGTDKGLVRFDGTRFQVYGVKEGLPDPEVLNLYEDSRQRLWISCFGQKPCYMLDGRLVTPENDSLLAQIHIEAGLWQFYEDPQRKLWIVGKATTAIVFDGETMLEETFPQTIAQMGQIGELIFALGTSTIIQRDIGLNYNLTSKGSTFKSGSFSKDQILVSLVSELILLEWNNGKMIEQGRMVNTEGGVFSSKNGGFWFCPDSRGAMYFNSQQRGLSSPVTYLPDVKVNAILEDNQGTLWFCTSGHGVYGLSQGKAYTYSQADGLETNNITALSCNQKGRILAGDDIGNLYEISGKDIQKTSFDSSNEYNRCRQIISLPGDTCWVANDRGLYYKVGGIVRKITGIKRHYNSFKAILANRGNLWYGNHHSLCYISPKEQEPILVINHRTTTLGQDDEGNIWAGRLDGLYSQRDSFQYNWGDFFPVLKNRIVAIQNAGNNKLWIVATDGGLLLGTVKNGLLTQLQAINQFLKKPVENIQSLYYEPATSNRVWLATNDGVYGLDPSNWNLIHFDQHDGLADNDVNCVLVAQDTLWAGTVAGLSCLPLALQGHNDDFGTFLSGIHYQSAGQLVSLNLLDSLSNTHRIILPPDAAMITLNLAGLNYRSQGALLYECITAKTFPPIYWWTSNNLLNWIKNGFHTIIDTAVIDGDNLNFGIVFPAGSYQIKVTAITAQGIYSRKNDTWNLIMRPYWYSTIWFDLFIWGLIVYALWRILRARTVYRKLNVTVSELQLQALQSQINPHFVGNSINAIQQFFYPPNPAAASNYIELFTRLLRRTIILSEKHFNNFEDELAYDRDYLQMIKLRFGDRFQYDIEGAETIPRNLPFPSMLLQPILENATIHGLAPEGISRLNLRFSWVEKKLRCVISDNGMGYLASMARHGTRAVEHKSKGLELLRKKVVAFNQLYNIGLRLELSDLSESTLPGTGTLVLIEFYPHDLINSRTNS